ncbi:MAG: hypothetical protein E6Q89_04220 [Bacteroidia bacterium]|nr:MAG: hypothetical protein E6Q89_04220 [Bacteroidia bacterium]
MLEHDSKMCKIDLLCFFQIIKREKKIIGIFAGVFFFTSLIYAIFATPIFTAKILINPPKLSDASLNLSNVLGNLTTLSSFGGGLLAKSDLDITVAMLNTNALKDIVIKKFNLVKYYEDSDIDNVRAKLSNVVAFTPDLKSGFLAISVEDKNPKLGAEIANYYVMALGKLISDIGYNYTHQRLIFFGDQLQQNKKMLGVAEENLKYFNKAHGIIAGQQTGVIISLVTQLQARLVVSETQLKAMSLYATSKNPDYEKLQSEINGIKKQLLSLNNSNIIDDKIAIPSGLAMEFQQQYLHLMREYQMYDEIYRFMLKQYELRKIDQVSERIPAAIQVIDTAQVPIHKSHPRRLLIVVSTTFLGLLLSFIYLLIINRKLVVRE